LGYDGPAPIDVQPQVAAAYKAELTLKTLDVLAWMRANRTVAQTAALSDGLGWLCLNACAYDTNGDYYYMAYKTPNGKYGKVPPQQTPGTIKAIGIYKVPKARWNTEALNWARVPQQVMGVSGVQTDLAEKIE